MLAAVVINDTGYRTGIALCILAFLRFDVGIDGSARHLNVAVDKADVLLIPIMGVAIQSQLVE